MWLLVINPAYIYSNFALYILIDKFAKVTGSYNCQIFVYCFSFLERFGLDSCIMINYLVITHYSPVLQIKW